LPAPARAHYVRRLDGVRDSVVTLGSMVDKAIDRAGMALEARDFFLARRVIREDLQINQLRFAIEQAVLELLATQQPMASDLRFLTGVLHIVSDLERMGDHARSVARLVIRLGTEPPPGGLVQVRQMAALCRDRMRRALDAFVGRDCSLAAGVAAEDTQTDALQDEVYAELLGIMISDPATIAPATYLLWVAHNLERIGDHITNVCERTIFTVTGRMEEINVAKRDL
jgi:phosphate transport system protein